VWEKPISDYLNEQAHINKFTVDQILRDALTIHDKAKWGRAEQMRVGNCLRRLGLTRARRREGESGERMYLYYRPGHEDE